MGRGSTVEGAGIVRREFPAKIKAEAFLRAGGVCEIPWCDTKLQRGRFTYDHVIPDWTGGKPTLENCQVICRECDRAKTKKDAGNIAKSKRIIRREMGIKKRSTFACSRDSKFKKKVNHLGCVHPKHVGWKTKSANQFDRVAHGRASPGCKGSLTPEKAQEIRALKGKMPQYKIAELYGTSRANISLIHTGKAWAGPNKYYPDAKPA
jgi:5-methylcytosine-specific restriction endonuclease McrA